MARTRESAKKLRPTKGNVPAPIPIATRWDSLDAFRGLAVVAMIAYHFAFDLVHFGWIGADPYNDLRWIACRTLILSSFLFVSGMSLALAQSEAPSSARFWWRIAKIGGAAMLVSIGSWFVFGERFIWFGVLHAIAVMSVVARPLLGFGRLLIVVGATIIGLGIVVHSPVFDQPLLQWIGMMTTKPRTEDYVPLVPWFGVVLMGAGAMHVLAGHATLRDRLEGWRTPRAAAALGSLGRHSLVVYLIHQPLLFGALMLISTATGR